MGKTYTPSYANILMAEWERHIFQKLKLKPLIYKIYLDDIFMVWTHSIEALQEFLAIVNTDNPCITLTAEHSSTQINFFDITLFIDPKKPTSIQTKIYHKPTDTMQLLHRQSFHPPATFSGLVKSQIIRFHWLSSKHSDFIQSWRELSSVLTTGRYNKRQFKQIFTTTLQELQTPKRPKYDKSLNPGNHPILRNISIYKPKATPCGQPRCAACPYLTPTDYYTSSVMKQSFPIFTQMSSDTRGIVYLFTCDIFSIQYVGMTKNELRHRFWNHRHAIKTQSMEAIPTHMNSHTYPDAYTITPNFHTPLVPNDSHLQNLRQMESYFINTLRTTQPQGLNTNTQMDSPLLLIIINYSLHMVEWSKNIKNIWDAIFQQEYLMILPHRPLTAFCLAAKNLKQIMTWSNISLSMGEDPLLNVLERYSSITPQHTPRSQWPNTPPPIDEAQVTKQTSTPKHK